MKNIIYFGYDLFYPCFEYLSSKSDVNILKVYSFESDGMYDFHDKIKEQCNKKGIPFTIEKITEKEIKKQFEENNCDLAFSAGYAYKIPTESTPLFKGVNIHPALLPNGRGAWPFPHIILKELKKSGVTVHKIAKEFDKGDIILQEEFDVSNEDNIFSLEEKARKCALDLTRELFSDFENCYNNAYPQGVGEYWPLVSSEDSTVYIDTPETEKQKIIRAFGKEFVTFSDKKRGE